MFNPLCSTQSTMTLYSLWNSPGQKTGVGSLSLLQGIFPTQGWNLGFPHCQWILYQLSHKGSPRVLLWVASPFSSGSSWSRNWTRTSCIAGGSLPTELSGKPIVRGNFDDFNKSFFSEVPGSKAWLEWLQKWRLANTVF